MKLIFTIFFLIILVGCKNRKSTVEESVFANEQFYESLNKVLALWNKSYKYPCTTNCDSLAIINQQLSDTLKKYKDLIFSYTDSTSIIKIAVSNDSVMAIASWDDWEGGTMRSYRAIAFYKTKDSVSVRDFYLKDDNYFGYDTIVTVASNLKKYYLARGFGRGSTRIWWEQLRAFEINADTLAEPAIFPEYVNSDSSYMGVFSHKSFTNAIMVESDIKYVHTSILNNRPVILFQNENNVLQIPIVGDRGDYTGKYFTLQFDGSKFLSH